MYNYTWPITPNYGLPNPAGCGCSGGPAAPCGPLFPPCGPNGCLIQLDTSCVIYHKNMNVPTGLINLNLPNGSTAELIFNTIDTKIGVLNVTAWNLPVLRALYTPIDDLRQFGQAVDTEIGNINSAIADLQTNSPLTKTDTPTIAFVLSGVGNHNISGNVKVSATANNLLTVQADGLYSTPQTLDIDYINKTLTITEGNTVDFSSLVCGASGFLGNVTADPTAIDGQYWFRTDLPAATGLKIKLNGAVRTITTS